jgi:hypothetical protein
MSPHLLDTLITIQRDMKCNPNAFTSRTAYEWFKKHSVAKQLYEEGII